MADDLSLVHGPVTGLFERALRCAQHYRLSESEVAFYRENGYLAGIRMLSDEQVTVLRGELAELMRPGHRGNEFWHEYHVNESGDPDNRLFHALGAWRIGSAFHDLLWNPAFTVPASQLLGGSVRFWHDQLFCKPARHGGVVAWHQDYSYWTRTRPMRHLTCWIGLDDATPENGCLHYVPGSHHWKLLPITGLATDMDAIETVLTEGQRAAFEPVAVPLRAGEATFHHPHLVHGSYANRTDRPRRATVLNVFCDGVRSDSDAPLLKGVPVIARGEPMQGQFFPLLYDPAARQLSLRS